jgi:hypothetical protein
MAPDPVPRSSTRIGARPSPADFRECCLDKGFRVRPRHERGGIEIEIEAPELPMAQDTGNRFAPQPAASSRSHRLGRTTKAALGRHDQITTLQPGRMTEQQAGIELGRR